MLKLVEVAQDFVRFEFVLLSEKKVLPSLVFAGFFVYFAMATLFYFDY